MDRDRLDRLIDQRGRGGNRPALAQQIGFGWQAPPVQGFYNFGIRGGANIRPPPPRPNTR